MTDNRSDHDILIGLESDIKAIKETCDRIDGRVNQHQLEIYGNKNYQGIKSMTHSNHRLINLIAKILIITGIVGGASWGVLSAVGGV